MSISRRHLLQSAFAVGAVASLANTTSHAKQEYANPANSEPMPTGNDSWKNGTKLVILGTQGGPIMNINRMMTTQAIMINGKMHLVDCGYGTMQRLAEMNIPIDTLKNFYLTHHHSDHMMDMPAMMNIAWATGMKGPVPMYAPKPIQKTLSAAIDVFSEDYQIRGAGGRYDPIQNLFVAKTVKKSDKIHQPAVIFEDDTVKVSAIKVPHSKFDLALGLRFDTAERSIAISGDTRISENVATLAKGADILVHEAMYWPGIEKMLLERGNGTIPKAQEEYFKNEHTTAQDAGKIASLAGVKTLVLSHLIGGPEAVTDKQWIDSAKQNFNGEVIVARDRMIL